MFLHGEESPATPEPDKDRSYTIICYMSCGGLDYDVTSMLNNLCQVTVPRHINILGIVKWTRGLDFDYSDGSGGVTRFKYNHGQRLALMRRNMRHWPSTKPLSGVAY